MLIPFQSTHARNYATRLLESLGCPADIHTLMDHPALSWRRAGLQRITGGMAPVPIASAADGALLALRALAPDRAKLPESGALLLGERARMLGLTCRGLINANGHARLLVARDGMIALNMAREADWALIPALIEAPVTGWAELRERLKSRSVERLIERGAALGLAIARDHLPRFRTDWCHMHHMSASRPLSDRGVYTRHGKKPLLVDLSALWAGPLGASLLQKCGSEVIKVESTQRPDGMRAGHRDFYTLLNGRKDQLSLPLHNADGIDRLCHLLERADIIIEASRPRALRQMGIRAEDFVARGPGSRNTPEKAGQSGKIWVRLTAYGQQEERVGFGDDIAVSAGAASLMAAAQGRARFMGDAIADPISGLHVAVTVMAMRGRGMGGIIDINMARLMRYALGAVPQDRAAVARTWRQLAAEDTAPLYPLRIAPMQPGAKSMI